VQGLPADIAYKVHASPRRCCSIVNRLRTVSPNTQVGSQSGKIGRSTQRQNGLLFYFVIRLIVSEAMRIAFRPCRLTCAPVRSRMTCWVHAVQLLNLTLFVTYRQYVRVSMRTQSLPFFLCLGTTRQFALASGRLLPTTRSISPRKGMLACSCEPSLLLIHAYRTP
jgi:hypothetical protein